MGPSPRVRGKHARRLVGIPRGGSIPASAGETHRLRDAVLAGGVHPRECGGNAPSGRKWCSACGPSPRVRGKLGDAQAGAQGDGSIPASAGETASALAAKTRPTGPSPRVRGKRNAFRDGRGDNGSIPASAGETRGTTDRSTLRRVHPRECGGNSGSVASRKSVQGPSPRVRGKPLRAGDVQGRHRSIPASAGETTWTRRP